MKSKLCKHCKYSLSHRYDVKSLESKKCPLLALALEKQRARNGPRRLTGSHVFKSGDTLDELPAPQ